MGKKEEENFEELMKNLEEITSKLENNEKLSLNQIVY